MKRWLAVRLQHVVDRLMAPVAVRIVEQVDSLARARHASLLARVEALSGELIEHHNRSRRESAEAAGRDLAAVVRMQAALESSVAELHALLRRAGQAEPAQNWQFDPPPEFGPRYVLLLGSDLGPGQAEALALTAVLRSGLDRLQDTTGHEPDIWLERFGAPGESGPEALTRDEYVRVLKAGTRRIEVLRPIDAVAIKQSLERNRRSDVGVVFRCIQGEVSGTDQQLLSQALTCSDHWIFPSADVLDTVLAVCDLSVEDRSDKRVHIHDLPEPTSVTPLEFARVYRKSVADVLKATGTRAAPIP